VPADDGPDNGSPRPTPGQMGIWERPLPTEPTGTICRRARVAAHWSQARLASRLGISQPSLSRAEVGARSFGYGEILVMAAAFGMPVDALLGTGGARICRRPRKSAGQIDHSSVHLARGLRESAIRRFVARGGSRRALRLAKEGRQPLSAAQAAVVLAVLEEPGHGGFQSRVRADETAYREGSRSLSGGPSDSSTTPASASTRASQR
jgi:transcriptional regulator with XRE-family HTH domain